MMKKALAASILCASCFSAQADTLLGIYAGASYWDTTAEGQFGGENSMRDYNFQDESKNSYWLAVEHFIPLVPNLKLRHNELDTLGNLSVDNIDILGKTFSGNVDLNAELDHTDIIMYYEILDNSLISIDLGLNLKYADYVVNFAGEVRSEDGGSISVENVREEYSGVIPMLYTNLDIGIPGTDINLYTDASFIAFDGDKAYDVQAGVKYRLIDNIAVNMDLQVGYRIIKIDVEDLSDLYIDAEWDGAFAGLELHF